MSEQNNPKQKLLLRKSNQSMSPGKIESYFVKSYERARQIYNQKNTLKSIIIDGEKVTYTPYDQAYYYDINREKIQIH